MRDLTAEDFDGRAINITASLRKKHNVTEGLIDMLSSEFLTRFRESCSEKPSDMEPHIESHNNIYIRDVARDIMEQIITSDDLNFIDVRQEVNSIPDLGPMHNISKEKRKIMIKTISSLVEINNLQKLANQSIEKTIEKVGKHMYNCIGGEDYNYNTKWAKEAGKYDLVATIIEGNRQAILDAITIMNIWADEKGDLKWWDENYRKTVVAGITEIIEDRFAELRIESPIVTFTVAEDPVQFAEMQKLVAGEDFYTSVSLMDREIFIADEGSKASVANDYFDILKDLDTLQLDLFENMTAPKESFMSKLKMLPELKKIAAWAPKRLTSKGSCQEVEMTLIQHKEHTML